MPLFFIIAIGAGAFTLGATAVDVTSDVRQERASHTAQVVQPTTPQAGTYATLADCVNAAAQQGLPASACRNS